MVRKLVLPKRSLSKRKERWPSRTGRKEDECVGKKLMEKKPDDFKFLSERGHQLNCCERGNGLI